MLPLYLISSACISPQPTFGANDLQFEVEHTNSNLLTCLEPDFKKYINPVQIRRMSRALKIGFTTAVECLQKIDDNPEAIIIGTGKGCLDDTEIFLRSIKEYNETALNATHFIHSTYNQLNGMISLNRKINSYNITYVHRGFSFEHSLLDAALLFEENEIETALVGCFDEITTEHFTVKKHWGYWKKENIESRELLCSKTEGTIAGEGSTFFVVSKQKPLTSSVAIQHISTLYKPSYEEIEFEITHLLSKNNLQYSDIDLLLLGENGDNTHSDSYQFVRNILSDSQDIYFKHLCGEYDTASSFGAWIASKILTTQSIPEFMYHPQKANRYSKKKIKHILMYNNYWGLNQTLMLMSIS